MGVLRFVLMATWAAWIWLELVAVAGPAVLDHLRGRAAPREGRSVALLLVCGGVAFVVAARIARLPAGALPGPPEAWLAGGLAVMWAGLALRAWSLHRAGGLFRRVVTARAHGQVATGPYRYLCHPAAAGALVAALGFGVALDRWTSLLVLVAGWSAGLAFRIRV